MRDLRNVGQMLSKELKQNLDSYAFSGLVSADLGIGTSDDKLTSFNDYFFRSMSPNASRRIYGNGDILQNIIDIPAHDATKEGFTLTSDYDDMGASKMIMDRLEELCIDQVFKEHLQNRNIYDDGSTIRPYIKETLQTPLSNRLSINTINRVESLDVITPDYFSVDINNVDPLAPNFNKPKMMLLNGTPVDMSRVIWNTYKYFPLEQVGVSQLHKIMLACLALRVSNWSLATVMIEVQNKVLKVADLDAYSQQENSAPDFRNRNRARDRESVVGMVKRWLTSSKMMVIDKDDDYQRTMYSATGVKEATDFFWEFLSAVSNRPQAVVKGQATGTISSADTDSLRYAESVRSNEQIQILKPALKRIINILKFEQRGAFYRKFGYKGADIHFEIEFNPIWRPDAKDEESIKLMKSQRGQIDIATGTRDADQVRRENYPLLDDEPLPEIPDDETLGDIEAQTKSVYESFKK
jgi:phage-related protein (TIGR01555 family)